MNEQPTTITRELFVEGMHCASCEMVVEMNLSAHKSVKHVKANLSTQTVSLHTDATSYESIHDELNQLLKDAGYTLHLTPPTAGAQNYSELGKAFLISLGFVLLFVLLQKLGLVNLLNTSEITLPFVFLIGVVASLSTCMAVVGGLVLSLSSSYAKTDAGGTVVPLVKFHLGRIIGFFVLGGVIGLLGSAFTLTPVSTFVLSLILFVVMVVLGFNLLDIFPFFKRFQLRMPKSLGVKAVKMQNSNNYLTPILLGISTFFLPCGFTQSMQIYSLTTGNFFKGALIMLVFALGTLPVLSLISFASVKLAQSFKSGLFFKTAGFVVLFFAVLNFLGALAAVGYIEPVLNL